MDVARRLYLYVIAGITLAMLVAALIMLLDLAADLMVGGRQFESWIDPRDAHAEQFSLVLAMIGVALPVWAVHWVVAQRMARAPAPRGAAERRSAIRALYLTVVLLGLLAVLIASAMSLLDVLLGAALSASSVVPLMAASALGSLIVAGGFWLYHAAVRQRDMRSPLAGAAAWLPRLYRYVAAYVGLSVLLIGITQLVTLAGQVLDDAGATITGLPWRASLAAAWAAILTGLTTWGAHWWYAGRVVAATDWRGPAEERSRTRYGYFVFVITLGAGLAIIYLSTALGDSLASALGSSRDGATISPALRATGGLILGLIFGGVWWAHRQVMIWQASRLSTTFQTSARRTDTYTVALIALLSGATGLSLLLGTAIELALTGRRTLADSVLGVEPADYLAFAAVGGAAWLVQMATCRRRRLRDEEAEAQSTFRRAYLLLALAGSLLAGLIALVVLLNRLFSALLEVGGQSALASELSRPAGVVTVTLFVAAIHAYWLRGDQRIATATMPSALPAQGDAAGTTSAESIRLQLVMTAPPGGDVGAALTELRTHLPDGYALEEAD